MARWQPGECGNPRGRPKRKLFDQDLKAALKANRGQRSKELVAALIAKAATGDVGALKLIAERVNGKPRPAEVAPTATADERLSREQVRQRLAEVLSLPEMKGMVEELLLPAKAKVQ
jgi:Family of unknown function (DUF5681)